MNRLGGYGFAFLVLPLTTAIMAPRCYAAGGTTIVRAVTNFFGKESAGEASDWVTKQGGKELAERLTTKATAEGGEATVNQVATLVGKYGPDAVRGLDNAPALRPLLAAIDKLPRNQIAPALARLGAGQEGKQLAEAVSKFGVGAMRAELKHPGIGVRFVDSLGNSGIALAENLTSGQAIAIGRHLDDIAKLPPSQRNALVAMITEQSDRFATFVGDFVRLNPGKTLFTMSGTALVLANKGAIFGGDEVVFDQDGNPLLMSKRGILERAGSRMTTEVSDRVVSPLVQVLVPIAAILMAAFGGIKLLGVWTRQQRALATQQESSSHTS